MKTAANNLIRMPEDNSEDDNAEYNFNLKLVVFITPHFITSIDIF